MIYLSSTKPKIKKKITIIIFFLFKDINYLYFFLLSCVYISYFLRNINTTPTSTRVVVIITTRRGIIIPLLVVYISLKISFFKNKYKITITM